MAEKWKRLFLVFIQSALTYMVENVAFFFFPPFALQIYVDTL